jgi:SSS family solute:Na+ symporter
MEIFQLEWIDYSVMIIYFVFVLGIGWFLRRHMKDASAFLEAGKSMPAWVAESLILSDST